MVSHTHLLPLGGCTTCPWHPCPIALHPCSRYRGGSAACLPSSACTNRSLPAAPVPGSARHLRAKQRLSAVQEGNLPQKVSPAAAVLQVGRCVQGRRTLLPARIQHSSVRSTAQVTSKSLTLHQATWACMGFLKNAMRSKQLISSGRGTACVTASPHTEVCVPILR